MTGNGDRPTVGHVNYSFFHSTQSFIYFNLVAMRRVRSVCLTRTPESEEFAARVPAHLEGDLYPYDPGGGATWSRGVSVRRAVTRLPPRVAKPVLDVMNTRIAPRVRRDTDPGDYLAWAEGILRERDARLIHAYFGPVAWRSLELRRRLGVPLVYTTLGDDIAPTVTSWWHWWIRTGTEREPDWPARLRELFAEGDLFLAEGPHLRDQLIAYGCPPERAEIQRMALPLERFEFRPRLPREDGPVVIVFTGRFCEQKGLIHALEAVDELCREGRDVELRLIGDETMTEGDYAARVYSFIRERRLGERVRMLGFLNHEDTVREMQAGDIFLHPSVEDSEGRTEGGAPTTILEAQALGMPVVSTTHCDIPYYTRPGESALLVPERDSAALADALRTLLDGPERWEAMGRAGRAHVEANHDNVREAARLEERYLALM